MIAANPLVGARLGQKCPVGKTHNPLVAGSSPARPTVNCLVIGNIGQWSARRDCDLPAFYRRVGE
jgi:hypothetical protein